MKYNKKSTRVKKSKNSKKRSIKRRSYYKKQKGGEQSLIEILKKYEGPSLSTTGTDKGTEHSYDTVYEKIFAPYRNKGINLLEIGLYSGADLLAFNEYFTDATFYVLI